MRWRDTVMTQTELYDRIDELTAERDALALRLGECDSARSEDAKAFEKRLEDAYARNRTVTAERDNYASRLEALRSVAYDAITRLADQMTVETEHLWPCLVNLHAMVQPTAVERHDSNG